MLELFAEMNALTEQMFNKNITKIYFFKGQRKCNCLFIKRLNYECYAMKAHGLHYELSYSPPSQRLLTSF